MHSAPAVSYPVGRCHIQAWLTGALWGFGALVCALWILAAGRVGGPQALALLAWAAGGVLAWRDWQRAPAGTLRWDGQQWVWLSVADSRSGTVQRALDAQRWLLLVFRPQSGRPVWLWLTREAEPTRWQALRRALVARPAASSPPGSAAQETA
jgi:hypothetical protein